MTNKAAGIEILEEFYNKNLPLFTPQAEAMIDRVSPDKFNQMAFRYTFSVEAMVKVSNIIENAVLANSDVADFHVSFQYLSRMLKQINRYEEITKHARGMWLYFAADTALAAGESVLSSPCVTVLDTADTPLLQYWFVVAYGPGVHMSLLAKEIASFDGSDRYYEGYYTFEKQAAYQLLTVLHQVYPREVPRPIKPELMRDR
jgi:hypothetical protein